MALGLKSIETRHWWTSHRGNLAIHAAKRWTAEEREFAALMGLPGELPLGAIVAVGQLVKIDRTEILRPTLSEQEERWGNYADGRFGWIFANIQALPEPAPFRGAQGLFDVPNSLLGDLAPPPRQRSLI
jgi:hypothetical protein